ncbi:MAG: hypothetical protein LBS84_04710 [Clostridiales bacterium]|jgi:putative DNA primase/helicase|nr:hypothetical protein [Clostridiales bacterium]
MQNLYDNIPTVLKMRKNWVVWGIQGAPLKSPFNPMCLLTECPVPAKAGVRETWDSYQNAVECVEQGLARGIGYEFDNISITGIDLDNVIDSAGDLQPEARNIADKLNSYTEISPSGTGLHILVLAPGANITRHRKKDCFLEIYNAGRYFTVTGNIYGGVKPINLRTTELQAIHDEFLLPEPDHEVIIRPLSYSANTAPLDPGSGQEWFLKTGLERDKVFGALWDGARTCGNESSDDQAFMNKLAYWCNADQERMIRIFLSSPYYTQKDEAHKKKCARPDYLVNTAKNACASVYSTAIADYEHWHASKREKNYER